MLAYMGGGVGRVGSHRELNFEIGLQKLTKVQLQMLVTISNYCNIVK